jgi:hypothetical protein
MASTQLFTVRRIFCSFGENDDQLVVNRTIKDMQTCCDSNANEKLFVSRISSRESIVSARVATNFPVQAAIRTLDSVTNVRHHQQKTEISIEL